MSPLLSPPRRRPRQATLRAREARGRWPRLTRVGGGEGNMQVDRARARALQVAVEPDRRPVQPHRHVTECQMSPSVGLVAPRSGSSSRLLAWRSSAWCRSCLLLGPGLVGPHGCFKPRALAWSESFLGLPKPVAARRRMRVAPPACRRAPRDTSLLAHLLDSKTLLGSTT